MGDRAGASARVAGPALAVFMLGTGITHFTIPAYYRGLMPSWLPAPPAVVAASGVLNIGVAALLAAPATRRTGGRATAALIAAYLPVHLDAAWHARRANGVYAGPLGATARLLVNFGYIAWALRVARG